MPKVRFFMGDDTEPFIIRQPIDNKQKIKKNNESIKTLETLEQRSKNSNRSCNLFQWFLGWF